MTKIYPLIICGGNGTRLWPMSRTQSPKQFQRVGDDTSPTFFQSAVSRHSGPVFEKPVVVSSVRHRKTLINQLSEIRADAQIILEPMGRNTGPAVLSAALRLQAQDPDALMLVVPADHVIEGDINATVAAMIEPAKDGHVITFGIKPRYAETGFGYITDGGPIVGHPGLRQVERFVEKPPTRKARLLVESDIAYWASGISMFSVKTIIDEYAKFDAPTFDAVKQAVAKGETTADGFVLDAQSFINAASEPTEVVVFEKTRRIALAPLDIEWSDVGSWTAMYGISESDTQGNVLQGDVVAVETQNSMIRSSKRLVTVVGLSDVIVIDTPDALLVTKVGHCQSVKKIAEHLKAEKRVEAERHVGSIQPWGELNELVSRDHMTLSSMSLNPGALMEMEPSAGRELMVASGVIELVIGDEKATLRQGERMTLTGEAMVHIANPTSQKVELVAMTLTAGQTEDDAVVQLARYA
ncbi:mannose-1-phosphate guanylyltransferase/mannose-6-phosphate isomerase [Thalassococcus sp. S3]|uniref:mannose-1-phosphate guanylyltransferase/mannose-6-phosphate isomerase n=1 Tax=Thalassococcus sp. S3 TaxID=2017482 RepID=UPI0010247C24|nr:mannose-1-phosphate guanylyltransferase/mannose-6-phosphate isomerase [Thalassococcus sp. S3]QBF30866.1 mannose-1-phosphate guanylyltransferase/mannose-6-phosphate isomerase [Thalassococcus sp. S3]